MARAKHKASKSRRTRGLPHDGLFQLAFSVPRHAESELKSLLSREMVARINWDTLRNVSGRFTQPKLTNRYSDILFEVEIDEQSAFIYILFEHKSQPERWAMLQVLEYMVYFWRLQVRMNPTNALSLVLPVVVHHGHSGWTVPREFIEYFGQVPDELRRYIPNFGILLDDVAKVSPEKLVHRPLTPEATLILLCLVLGRTPERFLAELEKHPSVLKGTWNGTDRTVVIEGIVVYMEKVGGVPQEETIMALQNLLNLSPAEEVLYAHEIRSRRAKEEGWREGKLEGKLEGELDGVRLVVTKLLTKRFGPLSHKATTHLQTATKSELEDIGMRLLAASTLEEVLGKPKRRKH